MKTLRNRLFDQVTVIYYHTMWRLAALIRRGDHPRTVLHNALLTLTGALNSNIDVFDRLFPGVAANIKAVEDMDRNQWPSLAYVRDLPGDLVALIYPFVTDKERLHARGQLRLYVSAIVINLLAETLLFSLLASFILPGAKPMSVPGLLLGFVLASFGTLAVHIGLKMVLESLYGYGYFKAKRLTNFQFIDRLIWALLGLVAFALNFFLVWYAAKTREAYFALSAASGSGQSAIYEALNNVVVGLSLAMPLVLACAKHLAKDAFLLLGYIKRLRRFEGIRAALLTKAEQTIIALYNRLRVIELAYQQLLIHQFMVQRKFVDGENEQKARQLSEALEANPAINPDFFMKYHSVWYTHPDMVDYALKRDPRYQEMQKRITEAQYQINYLNRQEFRKPFEVNNQTTNQSTVMQTHKPVQNSNGHKVLNGVALLAATLLSFLGVTGCKHLPQVPQGHNLVVAIDQSASTGSASQSYQQAALSILDNIEPGYTVTFIAVHGGSQTAGQELLQFSYTDETDENLTIYTDAMSEQKANYIKRKAALLEGEKTKLKNRLAETTNQDHLQRTDLFGALAVAKSYLKPEAETNRIVFLSDGLHDSGIRMLRNTSEIRREPGCFEVVMVGRVDYTGLLAKAPSTDFADVAGTKLFFFIGQQSVSYTPEVMSNTELLWKQYAKKESLDFGGFLSTPTPLIKAVYETD